MTHLTSPPVLRVEDLVIHYETARGPVQAVNGVSFEIEAGRRFGLVGESGCGKSTLVTAFLRMTKPPGVIKAGAVYLGDVELMSLGKDEMRRTRWNEIALIPQGAMNSLNPVIRVKDQLRDVIEVHRPRHWARREMDEFIVALLDRVELQPHVADLYPHQLSGGMKQRVCIAMATALNPRLIIADEPTSALDVVTQRAVMQMLTAVQDEVGASLILIGHDMGLVAQVVDRLAVMYAGKVAELGTVHQIYKEPLHPYTQLLLSSLPSPRERRPRRSITGLPPALINPPQGCLFHPRCPQAMDICKHIAPTYREVDGGHFVACHLYDESMTQIVLQQGAFKPGALKPGTFKKEAR